MKLKIETAWRRPWLFQNIRKPRGGDPAVERVVERAFGAFGATRHGGLRPEALDLLRPVLEFEPMGDALYEWGAVPEALAKIASGGSSAWSFTIRPEDAKPTWRVERELRRKRTDASRAAVIARYPALEVFAVSTTGTKALVEATVRGIAGGSFETHAPTGLGDSVFPCDENETRCVGWLNLENAFAFFSDEEVARGFADVVGVVFP